MTFSRLLCAVLLLSVVSSVARAETGDVAVVNHDDGRSLRVAGSVLLGVGAGALLAGGLVFVAESSMAASLATTGPARASHIASYITLGSGACLAVTGVVLLSLGVVQRQQTVWVSPTVATSGAGIAVGGRF